MEFRSLHIRCVWTAVRRLFLCVRVRVRVSVNVSVTACVCVCVRARARARVCCQCLVVVPRQVSHQRTLRYRPRFFHPPPPRSRALSQPRALRHDSTLSDTLMALCKYKGLYKGFGPIYPPHSQPRALRHTTVLSNIMSL